MLFKTSILALALAAAGLGLAAMTSTAHAQYPPTSAASVTVAASTTTTTTGSTVTIATVVEDSTGTRQPGILCSFAITDQPGTDASLINGSATTNSNGVASTQLEVGSTAGDIIVSSTCDGITGQTTVAAGTSTTPSQPSSGQPAAGLPSAGTGKDASGATNWLWLALGIVFVTAGGAAIVVGRRN
jgi:hypothetical protein